LEVGYIGRYARDLYMNGNMNSVPYTFKDAKSGQTFAQAFDAVATALRPGGVGLANLPAQPYFENLYGAGATKAMTTARGSDFQNGVLSNLAQINLDALKTGCQTGAPCPSLTNLQSQDLLVRFSGGFSNYHGLVFTLRKRYSQGFAFDFSY